MRLRELALTKNGRSSVLSDDSFPESYSSHVLFGESSPESD